MTSTAATIAELTGRRPDDYWALGACNMPLTRDAPFYIDPRLLERCTEPELVGAADDVYDWFQPVASALVDASPNDPVWNAALAKLRFKETKGVLLGLAETCMDGRGVGPKLAKEMLDTIRVFVKKGLVDPAILGLLAVAQPGFGGDRISDIIISVNLERFVKYSDRIYRTLGVTGVPHPLFPQYRLPLNPCNGYPVVLVPASVLRDLTYDELAFGDLFGDNDDLRDHFNAKVRAALGKKRRTPTKADYFRALVGDKRLPEVAKAFRAAKPEAYDFGQDPNDRLIADRAVELFVEKNAKTALSRPTTSGEFVASVHQICLEFKHFVENEKLLHRVKGGRVPELEIQRAFQALARFAGRQLDIEVSPEQNAGAGPVDFKFSRGTEMNALVEFKLADNKDVVKGYSVQVARYEEAERTDNSLYVVVDFDDHENVRTILEGLEAETKKRLGRAPRLVWVQARPRPSASKDPGPAESKEEPATEDRDGDDDP
jgi:hypothetical protein